jgi:hypothetical protein
MSTHDESATGFFAGGRHPVNIGHLVMGLAFLGMVGIWALVVNDVVDDDDIRWLLPVPWVFAGLGGLVALAVTGTRRHATRATGWVDGTAAPTGTTGTTGAEDPETAVVEESDDERS